MPAYVSSSRAFKHCKKKKAAYFDALVSYNGGGHENEMAANSVLPFWNGFLKFVYLTPKFERAESQGGVNKRISIDDK